MGANGHLDAFPSGVGGGGGPSAGVPDLAFGSATLGNETELETLTSTSIRNEWDALKVECMRALDKSLARHEELMVRAVRERDQKLSFERRAAPSRSPTGSLSQEGSHVGGDWVKVEYYYNNVTKRSQWDAPDTFGGASPVSEPSGGLKKSSSGNNLVNLMMVSDDEKNSVMESHLSSDKKFLPCNGNQLQLMDCARDTLERFGEEAFRAKIVLHLVKWSDWWAQLEEPPRTGLLARLIHSWAFETLSCLAIIAYSVVMVVSADSTVTIKPNPSSPWMVFCETFFLGFFLSEVCLRLAVSRFYFFVNQESGWNVFDLVLVFISLTETIETVVSKVGTSELNMAFLRSMRLLRMVKALRVLKAFRFVSQLRFMVNSLLRSFSSLFWCLVMLMLMFFLFSVAFVQGVGNYFQQERYRAEHEGLSLAKFGERADIKAMMEHFGSVLVSMGTLMRCLFGGDDWGMYYDILEPAGSLMCLVFLFFILFLEIAVLNIVTGVFVDAAMKLGRTEIKELAFQQRKQDMQDKFALREIFDLLDTDASGSISYDEFHRRVQDDRICSRMAVLGLSIKDAELFFKMLSEISPSPEIDIDFFIDSCVKMKGEASSLDLQCLSFETKLIHQQFMRFAVETRLVFKELLDALHVTSEKAVDASPKSFASKGPTLSEEALGGETPKSPIWPKSPKSLASAVVKVLQSRKEAGEATGEMSPKSETPSPKTELSSKSPSSLPREDSGGVSPLSDAPLLKSALSPRCKASGQQRESCSSFRQRVAFAPPALALREVEVQIHPRGELAMNE